MNDFSGLSTGRYHIIEKLGQGGMAVVYRAFDASLEMDVAIKFLRMDRITPEMLEKAHKRFKKEAQKTAQLMHANIVQVIDYGEFDGTPFLVMRYIKGGRTLKSVSSGSIPNQRAIGILLPIARALEAAHQKSIIHRDVKPSNILMAEDGTPLLSDFGIAKVLEEEGSGEGLTSTGMALGTPEYMAPEQWEGSKAVDGRADIYSLGVVLYEMITGRPPFKADTVPATMVQVLRDPLPRPRKWVPNLPEKVEGVLFKALAKSPEDRYQSMREFAAAMAGLIADTGPAQVEPIGYLARPDNDATADDAETGELTHDMGVEQSTVTPQPVPSNVFGHLDGSNRKPDSRAKTSEKKIPEVAR